MPFEYNGLLYLEYSINPHIVLSYNPQTTQCSEVGRGKLNEALSRFQVHGGAPALRYNENNFLGSC